jgi:hypothetical protein
MYCTKKNSFKAKPLSCERIRNKLTEGILNMVLRRINGPNEKGSDIRIEKIYHYQQLLALLKDMYSSPPSK